MRVVIRRLMACAFLLGLATVADNARAACVDCYGPDRCSASPIGYSSCFIDGCPEWCNCVAYGNPCEWG